MSVCWIQMRLPGGTLPQTAKRNRPADVNPSAERAFSSVKRAHRPSMALAKRWGGGGVLEPHGRVRARLRALSVDSAARPIRGFRLVSRFSPNICREVYQLPARDVNRATPDITIKNSARFIYSSYIPSIAV